MNLAQNALSFSDVVAAHARIKQHINHTPILESKLLNTWLGHRILFKAECFQKIGAFKIRGAINALSILQEQNQLPKKVVANSSGNHAQAVACAARLFGIEAEIYAANNISAVKAAATRYYGAELKLFDTREKADAAVKAAAEKDGVKWIPPFNHPNIMAGQGTAVYEALQETTEIDLVAAPCGGGGLLAGSYVAAKGVAPGIQVIGAEPLQANDAACSLRENRIVSLSAPAKTLADGAATPAIGEFTFPYLKQLDGFYEINEERIAYWTQWLQHLLKVHVEPTSAMTMEAVSQWLEENQASTQKTVLVVLSGGNIDENKMRQIWRDDHLSTIPTIAL